MIIPLTAIFDSCLDCLFGKRELEDGSHIFAIFRVVMNLAADIKRSQASTTEPSQRDNHANWDQQGHQEAVKADMTIKLEVVFDISFFTASCS